MDFQANFDVLNSWFWCLNYRIEHWGEDFLYNKNPLRLKCMIEMCFLCLNVAFTQKHCCKKVQFINLFANRDKTVLDKLLLQIRKKTLLSNIFLAKGHRSSITTWMMINVQPSNFTQIKCLWTELISSWRKVNIQSRIISG